MDLISRTRRIGAALLALALASTGAACGGDEGRSTAAFCAELAAVEQQAMAAGQAVETAGDIDPLAGLVASFGALGEIPTMMRRLEAKAPDEIRADMTAIADTIEEAYDPGAAIDNPLSALAGSVISGLMVQNQIQRVDQFARTNCGSSLFGS